MDSKTIKAILEIGETIAVEFKRCGNGIESDVYETVCTFLNRFGGDLFLGVRDDGTVCGVSKKAAPDMVKNFISCVGNPVLFMPTAYISPHIIQYEGKTLIHIRVLPSAEVHSYKKTIYNRIDDADVKVTATTQIAQMYVENANRASQNAVITPDNMEPSPKNPIIASFFRNIGYADQLGSGVRNLFKYSKFYSGSDPRFIEGDVFRIIVPLGKGRKEKKTTQSTTQSTRSNANDLVQEIIELIEQEPFFSQKQMVAKLSLNQNTLKYYIKKMREKGMIERVGSSRKGKWIVK